MKILVTIFLCFFSQLLGCTKTGLFIINGTATISPKFHVEKNIVFGPMPRHRLDVYAPQTTTQSLPVVVFFYGGSWQEGQKEDYRFMGEALLSIGVVAVIPDYQLYPDVTFPVFVEDGAKAVAWTLQNIKNYGGDPKQVYLMGHSAGAHIASLLAFDKSFLRKLFVNNSSPISGFIGLAGPYDFLPFTDPLFEKIFGPKEKQIFSQPIHFVNGHEPRTLLLQGKKDKTVDPQNTTRLAKKILEKQGEVVVKYYDQFDHVQLVAAFSRLLRRSEPLSDVQDFIFSESKPMIQSKP